MTTKLEQVEVLLNELITDGMNPNDILKFIEKVIEKQGDYALWGDMRWRWDTVCSICGSSIAGICGHQNDPNQKVIHRKEFRLE